MRRRRGLKVKEGKSKVMASGGEEGLECEVFMDGMRLEHMSGFKYVRYVLDESGKDEAEVEVKRRVAVLLSLWLLIGVCS